MKFAILAAFMSTIAFSVTGQRVTLSMYTNSAKWHFENHYFIRAQNIPCSKIVVKANRGKIVQNGCELIFTPDSLGRTDLQFCEKTVRGLTVISTVPLWTTTFHVIPMLGLRLTGPVKKKEILDVGGVLIREYVDGFPDEVPIRMNSYRIIVIRDDSAWSIRNFGARFSAQTLAILRATQSGDKLFIVDIESNDPTGPIKSDPGEFIIE